jgi:hypothetical protein
MKKIKYIYLFLFEIFSNNANAGITDFFHLNTLPYCVKNSIERIKQEDRCQVYTNQLKSIPNPSCLNGATHMVIVKTMSEANKENCTVQTTSDKIATSIAKSQSTDCIDGSLKRIKQEPRCSIYTNQLKSIPEPNCLSGKTTFPMFKIMDEARKADCRAETTQDKIAREMAESYNKSYTEACINNNIKLIKDEPKCSIYINTIKSIPEPSCLNGRTMGAIIKSMGEARQADCRKDIMPEEKKLTISNSNENKQIKDNKNSQYSIEFTNDTKEKNSLTLEQQVNIYTKKINNKIN